MDINIIGKSIKRLRKQKGMTQTALANRIGVSSKAVSKWETAKGLPDISLLEPLSRALGVSVMELMSGDTVVNRNASCNMLRSRLYVCPLCGNIIHATGTVVLSCCGLSLLPLEAKEADEDHFVTIESVENEQYLSIQHEMSKNHFISFVSYVTGDRVQIVKLYPEGNPEVRIAFRGRGYVYFYCNRHGLMQIHI